LQAWSSAGSVTAVPLGDGCAGERRGGSLPATCALSAKEAGDGRRLETARLPGDAAANGGNSAVLTLALCGTCRAVHERLAGAGRPGAPKARP
jgi:hypothetical protein